MTQVMESVQTRNFSAPTENEIAIFQPCSRTWSRHYSETQFLSERFETTTIYTRVGTLIVATIYLQLIQNRYMFRSFTVLHCSHQHCLQPVASDVEIVGYL